jgi:hypothetical protein
VSGSIRTEHGGRTHTEAVDDDGSLRAVFDAFVTQDRHVFIAAVDEVGPSPFRIAGPYARREEEMP